MLFNELIDLSPTLSSLQVGLQVGTEIDTECNETSSYTLIQDFLVLKACQK